MFPAGVVLCVVGVSLGLCVCVCGVHCVCCDGFKGVCLWVSLSSRVCVVGVVCVVRVSVRGAWCVCVDVQACLIVRYALSESRSLGEGQSGWTHFIHISKDV